MSGYTIQLTEAERLHLIDQINWLHDAIQWFDNGTVAVEALRAADAMRDTAEQLNEFLKRKLVQP